MELRRTQRLVLLLSMIFGATVPFVLAGPTGSFQNALGSIVQNVGILGSIGTIFGSSDISQLAGFLRVLYGIMAFALWYFAGGFVFSEQKNIRVTLAVVLSTLSVIFIPEEVIITITFGYSTLFASLLLAVVYCLILAGLLMTPSNTFAFTFIKFVVSLIVLFVTVAMANAFDTYALGIVKSKSSSFTQNGVALITDFFGLVDMLFTFFVGWYGMKCLPMFGYHKVYRNEDSLINKAAKFITGGGAGEKARKDAAYLKSRQLNDYVLEKREVQSLEAAKDALDDLEGALRDSMRSRVITVDDQTEIVNSMENAAARIQEAIHTADQLNKATFENERGVARLLRDVKRSGMGQSKWKFWQGKLADLEKMDQDLESLHNGVRSEMARVRKRFQSGIVPSFNVIKSISSPPVSTASVAKGRDTFQHFLVEADRSLNAIRAHLDTAQITEAKAYEQAGEMAAYFEKHF